MTFTTRARGALARPLAVALLAPTVVVLSAGSAQAGLLDDGPLGDLLGGACQPLPGLEDCDETAPETTIDQVTPTLQNGLVATSTVTFSFSATDDRDDAVLRFECRLTTPAEPSPAWTVCDPAEGASYELADADAGAYLFEVRASDDAVSLPGRPAPNVDDTPATQAFGVDTEAPDTLRFTAPSFWEPSRQAEFFHGVSDGGSSYECRLDGRPLACDDDYLLVTDLSSGRHRMSVAAVDAAGNVDPSPATTTWWVPRNEVGGPRQLARWDATERRGAFDGDVLTTSRRGAVLATKVRKVRQVGLVVEKGRSYGRVQVRLGKRVLGVTDLAQRRTQTELVTYDLPGTKRRRGVVRIVPLDAGRLVAVDAFFAS